MACFKAIWFADAYGIAKATINNKKTGDVAGELPGSSFLDSTDTIQRVMMYGRDKFVVPGDWDYLPANNPNKKPGQEGQNLIYLGMGQYWGHPAIGDMKHFMAEINGFGGLDNAAYGEQQLIYPPNGLVRRSDNRPARR